jgi:RNA methyltransferase, TrmH family
MRLPPPITSRTNARVKALRDALSGDARRPGDLLGLEGEHLVQEAHWAGMSFDTVYLREGSESTLERHDFYTEIRTKSWAVLRADVFDGAVSTATPQGIAATWAIQQPESPREASPVTMLVENLQDPGNLGTLIRTMAAFGMERVVVTPQTVNQWNPKVVRASAGASFRVPVERKPLQEAVAELRSRGVRLFAAVAGFLSGDAYGGFPEQTARNGVLTGRKLSREVERQDAYHVVEPAANARRYLASLSYDADFELPCAILIGNEGAGLSLEARMLADEQVTIPGVNESMNAAVAGSILLYEVMRQGPLRLWARQQRLRA